MLDGASLGESVLKARQQFVEGNAQMDPINLKTLAQFYLLGDPSIHPIAEPSPTGVPPGVATADAERFFRAERRHKMKLARDFLTETKPTASKRVSIGKLSLPTRTALSKVAKIAGLGKKQEFIAFAVKGIPKYKSQVKKITSASSRYHVAIGIPEGKHTTTKKIRLGVAVVAKEVNGRIIGYRIYHQR